MLTCRQLVERSSDFLDAQLNLRERLQVRVHLAMCHNCRRFIRQMRLSQGLLRQLPEPPLPELEALARRLADLRQSGEK